ncbi:hypothetical protein BDF22DRAFT_698541 [Syncephalis plumigaleata]|nr:hypothetical protein BDF22DRAFT_698541 [Syncephalis plumigaleata]
MQSFQRLFVPKDRLVKASLSLEIQELRDWTYYVQWRIRDATGSREAGVTERAPIRDHCVGWHSEVQGTFSFMIGKDGMLLPCPIRLRICHVLVGAGETERIGYLGLAPQSRCYLLQDSKMNSTLVLNISLRQTFGDIVYRTPPLNMSQINVDLSGIIKEHQKHQRHLSGDQAGLMVGAEARRRSVDAAMNDTLSRNTPNEEHDGLRGAGGMTLSRAIHQHARSFYRFSALQLNGPSLAAIAAEEDEPNAIEVVDAILARSRRLTINPGMVPSSPIGMSSPHDRHTPSSPLSMRVMSPTSPSVSGIHHHHHYMKGHVQLERKSSSIDDISFRSVSDMS